MASVNLLSALPSHLTALASEVLSGLTSEPKTLSPWLFYDEAGSALFERITELPEYYLTRTERGIFAACADDIVRTAAAGERLAVIELGAGTASKTGLLLSATTQMQGSADYFAIDVSESALIAAKRHLEQEIPNLHVHLRVADYTEGLGQIDVLGSRKLVLYIGSSIGNFEPAQAVDLLRGVREQLAPGDQILIGADQIKDSGLLLAAYNDAAGVTAAFNRNVLVRINRELGADFDLKAFTHEARWNNELARIEMHLRSEREQVVEIAALGVQIRFAGGETIHTENSYKFDADRAHQVLSEAGLTLERTWTDAAGWFAVYLAHVG
jgi:L-histidine N-alpha-methyltransferase